MKKILAILCTVLFLTFSNLVTYKKSLNDIMSLFNKTSYINQLNKITTLEPIYEYVPVEYREQLDEVTAKIQNDPKVANLIDAQINQALEDISNDETSFSEENFISELNEIIDEYDQDIKVATHSQLNSDKVKSEMARKIKGYNLKTFYTNTIKQIGSTLSPKQLKLLSFISTTNKHLDLLIKSSLTFGAISALILMILYNKKARFSFLINAFLQFINPFFLNFLSTTLSQKYNLPFNQITLDYTIYYKISISFLIAFLATFLFNTRVKEN